VAGPGLGRPAGRQTPARIALPTPRLVRATQPYGRDDIWDTGRHGLGYCGFHYDTPLYRLDGFVAHSGSFCLQTVPVRPDGRTGLRAGVDGVPPAVNRRVAYLWFISCYTTFYSVRAHRPVIVGGTWVMENCQFYQLPYSFRYAWALQTIGTHHGHAIAMGLDTFTFCCPDRTAKCSYYYTLTRCHLGC